MSFALLIALSFCLLQSEALTRVVRHCTVGATVLEIAELGDHTVTEMASRIYNQEDDDDDDEEPMQKGIAFPTSVAINECVGNFSPEATETRKLVKGDVVKMYVSALLLGVLHSIFSLNILVILLAMLMAMLQQHLTPSLFPLTRSLTKRLIVLKQLGWLRIALRGCSDRAPRSSTLQVPFPKSPRLTMCSQWTAFFRIK
jgi:hypothetical protein